MPIGDARQKTYDALGRVTGRRDRSGVYSMVYDSMGQLINEFRSGVYAQGYGVDKLNRVTAYGVDRPTGMLTAYFYNPNNTLKRQTPLNGRTVSFSYDAAGRRTTVLRPNGTRTSYVYDKADRMVGVFHHTTSPTFATQSSFEYRYDKTGNRTRILDSGNSVVTYLYVFVR